MVIFLVILIVLIAFVVISYNNLVVARQKVKNAWSQIDVQLQRRFDLIPNFVETVKGYMAHEKDTLAKVTELRTSWANAGTVNEKAELNNQLSGALKTIMAVSENYPDLKANQNFSELQEELQNTENKISYSRQFYNDVVTKYNTKLEVFPSNLIASMFKFTAEELFEVEVTEDNKKGVEVAEYALQFVGNPYAWGSDSLTEGADSSGFTKSVYAYFGISLPHDSREQNEFGTEVETLDATLPGDLVFYDTPSHVAIYIGDGMVVHSMPQSGICVSEVDFDEIISIKRLLTAE